MASTTAKKPKATDNGSRAGIQSVEVGAALLHALAQAPRALSLKDAAARAHMLPAKAHRYLVSYARIGLVVQHSDSGLYDLGPAALALGLAALNRLEPLSIARPVASALRDQIDQTVALAVWGNKGPTIVHWEDASHAVTVNLRLGGVMPLLNSATGRCFAAYLPHRSTNSMIQAELKQAKHSDTPTSTLPRTREDYAAILEQVRQHGAARVTGQLITGVHSFCVPVFDARGQIVLGLISLGYSSQFDSAWTSPILTDLRVAAHELSQRCGYTGAAHNGS